MISPHQGAIGFVTGAILILLGVWPGLFERLVNGVADGIDSFGGLWLLGYARGSRPHAPVPQPRWLAPAGAALIALTLLACLPR